VAIGAGVLSLPVVLKLNGWILGTLLIMVGAISGYYSMYMILVRSIDTKCKNFSELAMKAGGKPLTILLQISILSFMFGACVSYQIISNCIIIIMLYSYQIVRDLL
jgi:amino acid permease